MTLPDQAWPRGELVEWFDDETRTHYDFLNETSRPYTAAENATADAKAVTAAADKNRLELIALARAALATNRAYLAKPSPTGAQSTAQTKELTRQMNAVIRLVVNDLGGTD